MDWISCRELEFHSQDTTAKERQVGDEEIAIEDQGRQDTPYRMGARSLPLARWHHAQWPAGQDRAAAYPHR